MVADEVGHDGAGRVGGLGRADRAVHAVQADGLGGESLQYLYVGGEVELAVDQVGADEAGDQSGVAGESFAYQVERDAGQFHL